MSIFDRFQHKSALNADRSVRPALVNDSETIARIQADSMLASLQAGIDEPLDESAAGAVDMDQMTRTWQQTLDRPAQRGFRVLSALDGAAVVGFAAAVPGAPVAEVEGMDAPGTEIIALEVAAGQIGNGHRSRLLSAVTDLAKEEGAQNVRTWIIAGDDERIRFFQEAGLAPAGVMRKLEVGPHVVTQHLWWAVL
ncbi:MAG TPA: GNAT family N-acetyltransferase [Actinomyces sp.]|jgi:GNAT superfamily N-acetyltransferase|nr:GNAT family N-acetyltransferase [Acidobacteriota bacterium]HHT41710.1 GNAT family N-acetyltransferase [Actinomyces sp.]